MKRIGSLSFVAFVLFASLAWTQTCEARIFKSLKRSHQVYRAATTYQQKKAYLNWRYPKYIGGFHYSYFRDMGVPPGDVGFRSNGLYPTPW